MSGYTFADRMERLGTETAFEVLARARALEAQGRDVIHLEIGEPDFDTPAHIIAAAKEALDQGYTHYGPAAGLPELRAAIARHVSGTRGIPVDAEQVVVTPGAKPVMFFAALMLCQTGDEVLYPDPGFPIYESVAAFSGARPVPLRLRPETGFRLDLDELRSKLSDRTRLLILNSPHNPTGAIIPAEDLRAIADMVRGRGLIVLSDEIYGDMLYDGTFASIASEPGMPDQTIILDGFSKTFAMTGWRLGYGVMPRPLAERMTQLMVNSASCTAAMVQRAGLAALTGPRKAVDAMLAEFRQRRDLIVAGLNALPGVTCRVPEGAFYAFPDITGTGMSSAGLAARLLQEAGVAVLAGTAFGAGGEGFLRLSYANARDNLRLALARMDDFLARAGSSTPSNSLEGARPA
jgi:aspartate/methionine/tyrosine aminotransferase